jgi:translation initiation factor 2B subunit (eIF-2B alpha/beta/delta family)
VSAVLKEFEHIANDNTSGATELIHRLLALCESCAIGYRIDELRDGFALLEKTQQSLPSLHAVIHILRSEFLPKLREGEETAEAISYLSSVETILHESGDAIARHFAGMFETRQRVVTISRSFTVLLALERMQELDVLTSVDVLEARPMNEGLKTIRDLDEREIPSRLLIDAAMCEALARADIAVVGADSVSADGYLLNKTGTLPMAICCRSMEVPLYVLCDSLKFTPQLHNTIPLEDRPPEEVLVRNASDGFEVWNRYFEWVPVDYVRQFVTERGTFSPDQLSALVPDDTA